MLSSSGVRREYRISKCTTLRALLVTLAVRRTPFYAHGTARFTTRGSQSQPDTPARCPVGLRAGPGSGQRHQRQARGPKQVDHLAEGSHGRSCLHYSYFRFVPFSGAASRELVYRCDTTQQRPGKTKQKKTVRDYNWSKKRSTCRARASNECVKN